MADEKLQYVKLEVISESSASLHMGEDGELVLDECENFDPSMVGLIFDDWIIEALGETQQRGCNG
jgi:hypothetical protein